MKAALLAAVCALLLAAPANAQERAVPVIEVSGTIDPATERWLDSGLDEAERDGAPLAIVRLDTPGGLDSAMRAMVQRIIEAPMPVVVWVAPDGARAASAGLFLLLAGDVAAMAPRTNTGSATPVQIGGGEQDEVMGRKVRNDAAAYARALAEGHGRNADLAERMVREAENVAAPAARREGLIDLVVADVDQLLERLDGHTVGGPKGTTLATAGLHAKPRDMPLGAHRGGQDGARPAGPGLRRRRALASALRRPEPPRRPRRDRRSPCRRRADADG
jgi:membrane-bound serine protease (ClpP class)